jgi:copper(I)-binding protein
MKSDLVSDGPFVKDPAMKRLLHARVLWAPALWALALSAALGQAAVAQSNPAPIEVTHAWARATATTAKTGGAYLTIANKGASDDRLIAAATSVAAKAELHVTSMDGSVMKMRPLAALDVKAGGQEELKPGGMHIMLFGLTAPLKEGQRFPLALTFEKAGKVDVMVTVEKPGAMGGAMPGMKM